MSFSPEPVSVDKIDVCSDTFHKNLHDITFRMVSIQFLSARGQDPIVANSKKKYLNFSA